MSKIAFVFPGQGSQSVGMGRALADASPAAAAVFAAADDALGEPITRLAWEGPEDELNRTENAQPALLAASIAYLEAVAGALVPARRRRPGARVRRGPLDGPVLRPRRRRRARRSPTPSASSGAAASGCRPAAPAATAAMAAIIGLDDAPAPRARRAGLGARRLRRREPQLAGPGRGQRRARRGRGRARASRRSSARSARSSCPSPSPPTPR